MSRFRLSLLAVFLLAGCRLEDHTPAGSRRDEAQIRGVISEYYRSMAERDWEAASRFFTPQGVIAYPGGQDSTAPAMVTPADTVFHWLAQAEAAGRMPSPGSRVIRTDFRQADGYAAAWVTVRQVVPRPVEVALAEDVEHLVLQRTPEGWRIVLLTLPWFNR